MASQKRLVHPKPWELEVQSGFRELRPPLGPDTRLFLGEDPEGLGATTLFSYVDTDWSSADFRGIAVATRLRGYGGAHAREALDVALTQMHGLAHDAGATRQYVLARIDKGNAPSLRLFASAGFRYVGDEDGRLQRWALDTPV